ncbi:unnamed protein product [Ilex paraguariensis]|uniref:RNA polymerase I-specific transcription initiation factor RRN3 n=1 Tax=Ilex paraguariensis TaxID=185542 RepID=A0ABC8RZ72_9AQUA
MGVQLAAEQAGFVEMENVIFTDSELVHHVRDALRAALLGDTDNYNQLVGVLHHSERLAPDEVALLVAASSGKYVDLCLDMLVSNFMPPYSFLESLKEPRGIARKDQVLDRVHLALKDIADLLPLIPWRLEKIIIDRMPNIYTKEPLIVIYVENMLRLESGPMGELVGSMMITAVMDRLIDLDVEIPWEEILQDDSNKGIFEMELEDLEVSAYYAENDGDEDRLSKSLSNFKLKAKLDSGNDWRCFGKDTFSTVDKPLDRQAYRTVSALLLAPSRVRPDDCVYFPTQYGGRLTLSLSYTEINVELQLPREFLRQRLFGGNLVAEKLDSLLVLTLEHLKSCNDGGRLIQVFECLLQSFDKTVLTAYKSKFTQFVVFYVCSLDPENCGKKFASMLANIFMNDVYAERRMSAVAYLASYLSRAKFLPPSYVATMLESLVDWCSDYCKSQDGDVNPKAHRVFYSGCQVCDDLTPPLIIPRA